MIAWIVHRLLLLLVALFACASTAPSEGQGSGTYTVSGDSIQLGPLGLVGYDHRGAVQGRQITLRWSDTELDLTFRKE